MDSINETLSSKILDSNSLKFIFSGLHSDKPEKEARLPELLYCAAFENLREALLIIDARGRIMGMNSSAEGLYETKKSELINRNVSDFLNIYHGLSGKKIVLPTNRVGSKSYKNKELFFPNVTLRLDKRNPKSISMKIVAVETAEEGMIGQLIIAEDISLLNRMENELMKVQQLQSTRIFIGGIAHDFNNILTSIMGNISLARIHSEDTEKLHQKIESAEKACDRAQNLSLQLMNYSKEGLPNAKITSLKAVIEESVQFVIHGSNIECEFDLQSNLHPVNIDNNQICQVINNLIINAIHSMPEGGRITIAGKNVVLRNQHNNGLASGSYVRLDIRDTGIGIPQENLDKIFQPFFTTKPQGTGLGLTSCQKIILNHRGLIEVSSSEGLGSTFTIFLPASLNQRAPIEQISQDSEFQGSGRILIMDDDPEIKKVIGNMLNIFGYETDYAENEKIAYDLYKKSLEEKNKYAAVIIDLTIPGWRGGLEAVNLLRSLDKTVKAILTTGHCQDKWNREYKNYGFISFLAKPYKLYQLVQILKSLNSDSERIEA
jgi:two-component system, cell cycle sensor histidine kinase and response regulator CckA